MESTRRAMWRAGGLAIGVALGAWLTVTAPSPAGAVTATDETVVGTATITGAPVGWEPSNFYLEICPTSDVFSMSCAGQRSGSPDQSTGSFTVTLPATSWNVGMYYYTSNGEIILNRAVVVTAHPGATIHQNVTMHYVVPAVAGKVHLTGAPANFGALAYMGVQACPSGASFSVGCRGGQEAYEDVGPGSHYLIDLRRGTWSVAAYYRNFGNTEVFSGAPVTFTAVKGVTRTIKVTIAYQGI